jgi:hypothetical protein
MSSTVKHFLANLARYHALNPRAARPLMRYYRNEIVLALANGCTHKEVWLALRAEGKINFRYETFRRYSRALLGNTQLSISDQQPSLH